MRRPVLGIRSRLAWFAIAVSMPILGVLLADVHHDNGKARDQAEQRVAEYADRIALRLERRLYAFEHLLAAAARSVQPSRAASDANSRTLAALAQRFELGAIASLVAVDSTGRLIGWSQPGRVLPAVDLSDRPHFRAIMRGATHVIGRPVRLLNDTTVWGVSIAERIPGADGRPAGMLALTLRLSALGPELTVPDLPAGSVVTLRDSLTIIGRSADAARWVGRDIPRTFLYDRVAAGLRSERFQWQDSVERFTAWRQIVGAPRWQLAVGIPTEYVEAPLSRDLATAAAVGVIAMMLATAFGVWTGGRIVRPLRTLANDAAQIAHDEQPAQRLTRPDASVAEISALGDAFEAMLARVQDRTDALRASEAMAQLLFSRSPVPMWVADARTLTILDANAAAADLVGWSRDELRGRPLEAMRPAEDVPRWRAAVATIGDHPSHLGAWRYLTREGSLLELEVVVTRVSLDGLPAIIAAFSDVTEQRAAERALAESQDQLRQAQKMEALGRFAGGIAHDFNNLLTAILGQLELTVEDLPPDSPLRQDLEPARRSAERMAVLTKQILAFGRQQVVQPVALDLRAVVRDFVPTLERLLPSSITLRVLDHDTSARITADRAQVEQVLLNLVVNARDAMPEGGTITVSVDADTIASHEAVQHRQRSGAAVRLRVEDTGHGIEPALRARIFEPFFTTKPPGAGTGLGLATVYAILQQAGGVIRVDSTPGLGTTFDALWLVAAEATADRTAAEPSPRPALRPSGPASARETVLVVDDEDNIRGLMSTSLTRLGYQVLAASDGAEALEMAIAHPGPIHLVVTDCVMPRLNGRELAQSVRDIRPGTKLLFVSGHTDDTALLAAVAEERAAFLPKPFTPGTLSARVRELLDA
jgi:PAS domain S-box-containing protein